MIPVNLLGKYRTCLDQMFKTRVLPSLRMTKALKAVSEPMKHFIIMQQGQVWIVWSRELKQVEGEIIDGVNFPHRIATNAYSCAEWDAVCARYIGIAEAVIEGMRETEK